MRVISQPASPAEIGIAIIIGVIKVPEVRAETPITPCRYSGIIVSAPNMPAPVSSSSTAETAKVRFLNRNSGTSGSAARASTATKPASATSEIAISPIVCAEAHS